MRTKRHVLCHGLGKQLTLWILKHHADLCLNRGGIFLVCQVEPQRVNGTLLGTNQAVEMLDQRRLTRTGMTCQAQELAAMHRQRYIAQRPRAAGVVSPESLFIRFARSGRALAPSTALAGTQRVTMREVRNLDDGLRHGCPVGCRGDVVEHTRIGCRRPPCGVFPTPVGIYLRNLGDHIRLAHLRMNGHALRTKCHAQAARRRHIQVELHEPICPRQNLLGRTEHGNAPRPKYRDTIGLGGLFHKVRNHHDGHAAIVQRVASLHEALASTRIEHRGRLVQNEHARFHGEHTGKRRALLLTARKRVGLVALKAHQAHALQRLAHALRDLGRFDP